VGYLLLDMRRTVRDPPMLFQTVSVAAVLGSGYGKSGMKLRMAASHGKWMMRA
jgi:hypothetical protein